MIQTLASAGRSVETRPNPGKSAFLGISAKSIHAGEGKKSAKSIATPAENASRKRYRFDLARTAASILFNPDLPAAAQHRTCWCNRTVRNEGGTAYVYRTIDGSSARLSGVTTCGSVWACPVCAARIAEERRRELQFALVAHIETGGAGYLLTATFPHERDAIDLVELMKRQAKALQSWKNSRPYKRILGKEGSSNRRGSIRSLETTHGRNGWHPHVHELAFCRRGAFGEGEPDESGRLSSAAIDELRGAWIAAIVKADLCPNDKINWAWRYALDVRGGDKAAEYIAKFGRDERWGASSEMTAHISKTGRRTIEGHEHRTPFQILADAQRGDPESWRLFSEYAHAFSGRRQLTWSPGLKKSLGVLDRDDDEIAADETPRPEEVRVGELTSESFALVTSRAALGELIEFVALACDDPEQSQACIDDFIDMLRERSPTSRPTIRVVGRTFDHSLGRTVTKATEYFAMDAQSRRSFPDLYRAAS